jgi:hypothetical protein
MNQYEKLTNCDKSCCHLFLEQHMRELNLERRHRLCKKSAASLRYLKASMLHELIERDSNG